MDLFRSRWDVPILGACISGVRRFDDLQRELGLSRKTLAERLKYLVGEDLLTRERYQERPIRYEYRLTAKGQDLRPAFRELKQWSERWSRPPD
jgi:DNA-binding HxlR family transcriptional regulator